MHYVLHEFFANRADVLGQSGREHHDLFVVGCLHKDGLDISPHVCHGGPLDCWSACKNRKDAAASCVYGAV